MQGIFTDKVETWLERAAKNGNNRAKYLYAPYIPGIGIAFLQTGLGGWGEDPVKVANYFKDAASSEIEDCIVFHYLNMLTVLKHHAPGFDSGTSYEEKGRIIEKLAENGEPNALLQVFTKDPGKYINKVKELGVKGNAWCMFSAFRYYAELGDFGEANHCLISLVRHPDSNFIERISEFVFSTPEAAMARFYTQQAERGDVPSLLIYANFCFKDNPRKAEEIYRNLVLSSNVSQIAYYLLGNLYNNTDIEPSFSHDYILSIMTNFNICNEDCIDLDFNERCALAMYLLASSEGNQPAVIQSYNILDTVTQKDYFRELLLRSYLRKGNWYLFTDRELEYVIIRNYFIRGLIRG